jgi:HD-GYP domain-containing protein (c-di-GMP phosphodiesterase class II)
VAERSFNKGESVLCTDATLPAATSVAHSGMTSIICTVLRSPRRRLGVLHVSRGAMQTPFTESDFHLADAVASIIAVGIESALAVDRQKNALLDEAVAMAHQAIAARDPAAAAFGSRTAAIADVVAQELGLAPADRRTLRRAALLHEVGELAQDIRCAKPCADAAQRHLQAEAGIAILEKMTELAPLIPVLRNCREFWNGTGFPKGLRGEAIPFLARLLGAAAALAEMTMGADQRCPQAIQKALQTIAAQSGSRFDPVAVTTMARIQAKFNEPPVAAG